MTNESPVSESPPRQFSLGSLFGFTFGVAATCFVVNYLHGLGGYFTLIGPVLGSIAYLFAPMWVMAAGAYLPIPRHFLRYLTDVILLTVLVGVFGWMFAFEIRQGVLTLFITLFIWGPQLPAYFIWRRA